jgi:hypothetical protein
MPKGIFIHSLNQSHGLQSMLHDCGDLRGNSHMMEQSPQDSLLSVTLSLAQEQAGNTALLAVSNITQWQPSHQSLSVTPKAGRLAHMDTYAICTSQRQSRDPSGSNIIAPSRVDATQSHVYCAIGKLNIFKIPWWWYDPYTSYRHILTYSDTSEFIPTLSDVDAQNSMTHATSQMHSDASQAILMLSSTTSNQ